MSSVCAFPPAVTVHSLAHVRRALAAGRPVLLLSGPAAAVYAGAAWWRHLIAAAGNPAPDLLDCADAPGRALEALSLGCKALILRQCPAWPTVAERAERYGAVLVVDRPPSLDLATQGADRRIDAWLGTG